MDFFVTHLFIGAGNLALDIFLVNMLDGGELSVPRGFRFVFLVFVIVNLVAGHFGYLRRRTFNVTTRHKSDFELTAPV